MVLIDATTLLLFLSPLAEPPRDPVTNLPIEHAQLRVEHLVKSLEAKRTKILVPAPALSEVLVHAGTAADGTWAKIKYDRQIVAIAKVHGVEAIYSDDGNIRSFATRHEYP
jgi:hypothetical protein